MEDIHITRWVNPRNRRGESDSLVDSEIGLGSGVPGVRGPRGQGSPGSGVPGKGCSDSLVDSEIGLGSGVPGVRGPRDQGSLGSGVPGVRGPWYGVQ